MSERKISPQEVILNAFEFFKKTELSQQDLVTIALAANCPSEDMAKKVLANMVSSGELTQRQEKSTIYYKVKKVFTGKQLN